MHVKACSHQQVKLHIFPNQNEWICSHRGSKSAWNLCEEFDTEIRAADESADGVDSRDLLTESTQPCKPILCNSAEY